MQTDKTPYIRQIFVCTNNANGEKASCGDHKGEEVFRQLRQIAKQRKLHPMVRVAQAKCLGQCNTGVNIMVYPDNIWHSGVRLEDVQSLADRYINLSLPKLDEGCRPERSEGSLKEQPK